MTAQQPSDLDFDVADKASCSVVHERKQLLVRLAVVKEACSGRATISVTISSFPLVVRCRRRRYKHFKVIVGKLDSEC